MLVGHIMHGSLQMDQLCCGLSCFHNMWEGETAKGLFAVDYSVQLLLVSFGCAVEFC